MSGQDSIRGYIFQSIVALLDSLQNSWESICIEPNIGNDKIDIIWTDEDQSEIVCQVKSSINNFGKTEILDWILGLHADNPSANKYNIILVGTSNAKVKSFFNSIHEKNISDFNDRFKKLYSIRQKISVKFYPLNYETLKGATISLIHKFLSLKGISVDYFSQELISEGLVNQIMVFSTSGRNMSKTQFEQKLLDWIRYNYSNCFTSTNQRLSLSFYLTNNIDFQKSISALGLPEISDLEYIQKRKEKLLTIFNSICSSKVEEKYSNEEDNEYISPLSKMYRFEIPKLPAINFKNEPVIISKHEKNKITLLTKELLDKALPNNFFGFGNLKESKSSLTITPWSNDLVLSGTSEEKVKKELFDDYLDQLYDLDDLLSFWNKVRKFAVLPIVLKNDSSTYEEGLRIKLAFPKSVKILKPIDFPRPNRFSILEEFNKEENFLIYFFKHYKDSKVNEYCSKKYISPNFDTLVTLSSMKSFTEQKELQIDRYYKNIDFHFDFQIFGDQSDKTIIECEIEELNANEIIAFPSYIFTEFNDSFTIEYEINSKTLSSKVIGTLEVRK